MHEAVLFSAETETNSKAETGAVSLSGRDTSTPRWRSPPLAPPPLTPWVGRALDQDSTTTAFPPFTHLDTELRSRLRRPLSSPRTSASARQWMHPEPDRCASASSCDALSTCSGFITTTGTPTVLLLAPPNEASQSNSARRPSS